MTAVPECVFCGEPAELDRDVLTLLGVLTVAVCTDCAAELMQHARELAERPGGAS